MSDTDVTGIPEGGGEKSEDRRTISEDSSENFPNIMTDIKSQIF